MNKEITNKSKYYCKEIVLLDKKETDLISDIFTLIDSENQEIYDLIYINENDSILFVNHPTNKPELVSLFSKLYHCCEEKSSEETLQVWEELKSFVKKVLTKETTFLKRLILEEEDLGQKIEGLSKALNSYGFYEKVGDYQFELLGVQHSAMLSYRIILRMRIKDLRDKE